MCSLARSGLIAQTLLDIQASRLLLVCSPLADIRLDGLVDVLNRGGVDEVSQVASWVLIFHLLRQLAGLPRATALSQPADLVEWG